MTKYHDKPYLNLIKDVLENGTSKGDRTGTGTISVFGREMRFDLSDGTIPLLTTKKMHVRSIIHELLWYLSGESNIKYLQDNGVRIWNEWADENGDLGPVYGQMFRRWPHYTGLGVDLNEHNVNVVPVIREIDQIQNLIDTINNDPNNRRMIVSAWNVGLIDEMALPPCHAFFQFYVNDGKLSCKLTQRSCDVGLGVPFNIVQYSMLLRLIAHVTDLTPGEFIWSGGDVHVYNNHIEALKPQLLLDCFPSPKLLLNPDVRSINDFKFDDFTIVGYESHPTIKMEVSV